MPLNCIGNGEVHHRMNDSKVSSPLDHSRMRGPSSNGSCLFRIIGQYAMQAIVDDGELPIPRFEDC